MGMFYKRMVVWFCNQNIPAKSHTIICKFWTSRSGSSSHVLESKKKLSLYKLIISIVVCLYRRYKLVLMQLKRVASFYDSGAFNINITTTGTDIQLLQL